MAKPVSSNLTRLALGSVALALGVPAVLAIVLLSRSGVTRDVSAPVLKVETLPLPAGAVPPPSPPLPPVPRATPVARVVSVLQRPDVFDYGAYVWNGEAARSGPVLITVDLKAQLIRVWRGGHEIGVSTILYGAPDSPTPLGTFPITQKDADHVSNIYHSPMPYSLRLTNDGVMVHGSNVRAGWASNGCVGVPTPFAKQLFGSVKLGDKVVITDGKPLAKVGDPLPVV